MDANWHENWTCEPISKTATHISGVVARTQLSPTDPSRVQVILENADKIDGAKWNTGALTMEAMQLWVDGAF